ncbi:MULTISPECIES: SUMF1/EgtB/PvdO family nonheme iron enzyme [Paraburkholderia]|uniref:formylglycine-generating enzyme family protein n=1 Tax=Paraburkholderia TaxID=1822464 RepID=UPI002254A826|nr:MULTISPECIES: SUMF1/EgtB/PvdO family nonheme iron enzyme [Paraburkholderia]MCX4162803.1 SUMF1/EgtB/PvdO family nonheme iron enzyme [Paraburkholderia megapolitana]MDN7158298.1 formylglycine-generating enzyme family protein [Paraburkholderia sp. CHISQ3]MDQ6495345.1 formylglycine-generating enzyme family protein [Paraburkholderia megapolitana]
MNGRVNFNPAVHATGTNPNLLSPREAMGLPASLVDRLGRDVLSRNRDLLRGSAAELVAVLEDQDASLPRRFAAGAVLALVGDPRIDVLRPPMVELPGGMVKVGLPVQRIEDVVERWRHVGVVREWIEKECPEHMVQIQPFALGRYPVTHAEYREFLEDTQAHWLPSSWQLGGYPSHLANHPVWTVPPEAADAYTAWLAQRTGRAFRLPTETEWEYAASSGDGREFPWGSIFEAGRANTVEDGPLCTTPVGIYPAGRTPSGIDDLAGNVEEYTADNYAPYPGGAFVDDDLHLKQGTYRVARGGSFSRYGDLARCARRHGWYHSPIYAMGFRLAESL